MGVLRSAAALLLSAHLGPSLAVTMIAAAYGVSVGLDPARLALMTSAVLAGQLSVGWSNDLVDVERDRAVGRRDKPLARGAVSSRAARVATALAVLAVVVLSLACGPLAGLVHLACVVAAWAYNLGVKATAFSWLPFAFAFAGLPVFVSLAEPGAALPPLWVPVAGGLLGVGAHFVNVLPDLLDDEATGVRGLPHRLGERWSSLLAVAVLGAATVVLAVGTTAVPVPVLALVLLAVAALAGVALVTRGRGPFRAAVGIALVDVLLLVVAG